MATRKYVRRALLVAGFAPLVAALSCGGGNQGFSNNGNCDYYMFPGVKNGGTVQFTTNAACPSFLPEDWQVGVEFRGDPGGAGELPGSNPTSVFTVAYYDVTYRNNRTGGTTPGVDVPFPIRVPVSSAIAPGGIITLTGWPVLEPGQKEQAPLNDSTFFGAGGVPFTCTLTWWGFPENNPNAMCFQTMDWEITVFNEARPTDPIELQTFITSCF